MRKSAMKEWNVSIATIRPFTKIWNLFCARTPKWYRPFLKQMDNIEQKVKIGLQLEQNKYKI